MTEHENFSPTRKEKMKERRRTTVACGWLNPVNEMLNFLAGIRYG